MIPEEKQTRGCLVLVVGPSGAGKDSLIAVARDHFCLNHRVSFVTRTITRPLSAGEDHQPATPEQFEEMVRAGSFALHWEAHGLRYGLPTDIDEKLAKGHLVVANGSRAAIEAAKKIYPDMSVVNVTAAPEVIAARLKSRGRESHSARQARIARSTEITPYAGSTFTIDNSGPIEIGGRALVEYFSDLLGQVRTADA